MTNSSRSPQLAWRNDIEGLRGIAIILVVLYHANVPGFSGGYIGVDVFFVLSGYLITGILISEAAKTGRINLVGFYARRARRLLPASALLLLFVVAFAFLFYGPLEQLDVAKTAIPTALYISNIFFGRRATGYLAGEEKNNPLLHTWSLAVEEQFYIFWPAFMILLLFGPAILFSRKGRTAAAINDTRLIWGTTLLSAASFSLTIFLMNREQVHWAFFLSPPRAWEFAVGSLGMLLPRRPSLQHGALTGHVSKISPIKISTCFQIMGWIGLMGIIACGMLYTVYTPFPGWAAMLPALATVFVLHAGHANTASSLVKSLSWRPLRVLGRLSYSWYLWHWPILVFALALFGELALATRLLLLVLSLGLAELSYQLVENPIRHNRKIAQKPIYGIYLLGAITSFSVVLAVCWFAVVQQQLTNPLQALYLQTRSDGPNLYKRDCVATISQTNVIICSDGPQDASFTVILFGDSHAAQWAPALQEIAAKRNWQLVYLTKSACPSINSAVYRVQLGRYYTECDRWRASALETIAAIRPNLLVMSNSNNYLFSPDEWRTGSEDMFKSLTTTAENVIVIRDPPHPQTHITYCLSRQGWQQALGISALFASHSCDFSAADIAQENVYQALVQAAAQFKNIYTVDLTPTICPEATCDVEDDAYIKYRDTNHLTAAFVASLATELEQLMLARIGSPAPEPSK